MKKILRVLLPCVLAIVPSAVGQTAITNYDVVLLIGQSNMSGYGTYPSGVTYANDPDAAVSPNVFMWNYNSSTIVPAQDVIPQSQSPVANTVGPGLTFGKAYAASLAPGHAVLLVGAACGSTGFNNGWLAPTSSSNSNSGYATLAVSLANNAMAAAIAAVGAGNVKFQGFVWDQGENDIVYTPDGTTYPNAPVYQTNLINLINYLRTNVTGATSTSPFVVTEMNWNWLVDNLFNSGKMGTSTSYIGPQYTVLTSLHSLPDNINNAAWTGGGFLAGDAVWGDIHYSAYSQRQMGKRDADRFFEAGLGLPQPEAQMVGSAGVFHDIGRAYPNGQIPVNFDPTTSGTVTQVVDTARGSIAQISQAAGFIQFNVPSTTFNGSYTKMAWFKPGAAGYYNNLVSAYNNGQTHYLLAQTTSTTTLSLTGGHSDGGSIPLTVSANVSAPAGVWENVALVYDANAKTMTLYYNGAVVSTATNVAAAPSLASGSTIALNMGAFYANSNGTGAGGVDGSMGGNRVWTSALTSTQIAAIYTHEQSFRAGW